MNRTCDICGDAVKITRWMDYHLFHNLWSVYCKTCADKLEMTPKKAKESHVYIVGKSGFSQSFN